MVYSDYMPSKRFTRTHWITLGLEQLKTNGPAALTIDALCEAADKTRGSFYFHFETVESFLQALAEHWTEIFTTKLLEDGRPPSPRKDCLNLLAARVDLALETGIRRLAQNNDAVAQHVNTADNERINWLASLYAESGEYAPETADHLARIEYAAFTGFRLVDPAMEPAKARALYDTFLTLTGRA